MHTGTSAVTSDSVAIFAAQAERIGQHMERRLSVQRSLASEAAEKRGHNLEPWKALRAYSGVEVARCARCHQMIAIGDAPVLSGYLLDADCSREIK